jgi:Endodeoxyribonuclease RusA
MENDRLMPRRVAFAAHGRPSTQGSKTGFGFRRPDGSIGVRLVEGRRGKSRDAHKSWRATVSDMAAQAMASADLPVFDGAVGLSATFFFIRPKGHFTSAGKLSATGRRTPWPTTKRLDLGKLVRCIEDSMTGVVYRDDALICVQEPRKVWCDQGEPERVEIVVWAMAGGGE